MKYYICNYADYENLPTKLFCDHTPPHKEMKSIDGTEFIARCRDHLPTGGCLSWMSGSEAPMNHDEILTELQKPEWTTGE